MSHKQLADVLQFLAIEHNRAILYELADGGRAIDEIVELLSSVHRRTVDGAIKQAMHLGLAQADQSKPEPRFILTDMIAVRRVDRGYTLTVTVDSKTAVQIRGEPIYVR